MSPCNRDAEVLSLFAAIINKLREKIQGEVPRVFEAVFECTLTMITKNFEVCCARPWPCIHLPDISPAVHRARNHLPTLLGFLLRAQHAHCVQWPGQVNEVCIVT